MKVTQIMFQGKKHPPPTDEERMKMAAIKCAVMEDEIEELLRKTAGNKTRLDSDTFTIAQEDDALSLTTSDEGFWMSGKDMKTGYFSGEPISPVAPITLTVRSEIPFHGLDLGRRGLNIQGFVSDGLTQNAYNKLAQRSHFVQIFTGTSYFFDKDGSYKKIVQLPKEIVDPSRQQNEAPKDYLSIHKKSVKNPENIDLSINFGSYESEMTEHDFEIAGQALVMLRDRLLEAQGQTPVEKPQQ